jgi:hypothetical protein
MSKVKEFIMSAGKNKWSRTNRRKDQRKKKRISKGVARNSKIAKRKEKKAKRLNLLAKNK